MVVNLIFYLFLFLCLQFRSKVFPILISVLQLAFHSKLSETREQSHKLVPICVRAPAMPNSRSLIFIFYSHHFRCL